MRGEAFVVVGVAAVLGGTAQADPHLEASGFVGFDYFGTNTQLGNSWAPEQIPGTAPAVGARVLGLVVPDLATLGRVHLALGVEGELAVATAYTGGSFDGGRMSYFAPVFGWRGHALLRAEGFGIVHPHLIVGAGGETVASSSPFMSQETDPEVYWGLGVTVVVSDRWMFRIDGRHGIMPGRDGASSLFEMQLGVGATFGLPHAKPIQHVEVAVEVAPPPPKPEPKPVDVAVIPAEDPDGDGIVSAIDKCPDVAEDFDHFEDDDGCPDPDNDHDGIADARDACPDEAETRNGFDDDDGCPDVVPAPVTHAIAAARAIKFESGRARITPEAKRALAELVEVLGDHESLRIAIAVHAERAGAAATDLAHRRADAMKWYLVDQGPVADRITTADAPVAKGPLVDLALIVAPAPTTP